MNKKDKLHSLVRSRKQKVEHQPIVGMVVLNDSRPSNKSVSTIADRILQVVVKPKNRAIVEQAMKEVLESSAEI